MGLQVRGKPFKVEDAIVGRVTRNADKINGDSIFIVEDESVLPPKADGALAIISVEEEPRPEIQLPQVCAIPTLDHLGEGDLVSIGNSGIIHTLYGVSSMHNSILVTEMCNSKCLMCSQPPKKKNDIPYLFDLNRRLIPMIPRDCTELTITGGEPTLMGDQFFEMLRTISRELPQAEIHVLTNGRKFASLNFTSDLEGFDTSRVVFGIPLYSDYYASHDYIVQAESAFYQTMQGLHNLARLNQRIELRVVLHRLTIERLSKLARYIYRNLPFAEHVAFMGLENAGFAPYNSDLLWIDPHDYTEQLKDAVMYLDTFGVNVSIYNHQLCTLPKELWRFARKSISEWKNIYFHECDICEARAQCGGFFQSSGEMRSRYIKPVLSSADAAV